MGEGLGVVDYPVTSEVVHHVHDFRPDDELREALHEEDHGEVEGEVEDCPDLLSQRGKVSCLHPVEVDEEDEVGCCDAGGDNSYD